MHNAEGDAFKSNGNVRVEACYIHELGQGESAHGDGIQMMGGANHTIVGNNFNLISGSLTACIFPGGGSTPTNILVDGNRLNGGAYIVYGNSYMTCTNNVFGRTYSYGPKTGSFAVWSNNRWEDTGELIP